MSSKPLTDLEVYERLQLAHQHLMFAKGETPYGENTLRAAEKAVSILQITMLCRIDGIDPKSLDATPGPEPHT